MAATDVEAAVDELATEKANAQALTDHIDDTTDAHDASAISVADAGGDYTATDVEGVLAEIAPQLGGGAGGVQVDFYTASATWTKPDGCTSVTVICQGGGGGGGSGRRGAAGSGRSGGGGGGGGSRTETFLPASALGATEAVTIGTQSIGGAAQTSNDGSGNPGTAGAEVSSELASFWRRRRAVMLEAAVLPHQEQQGRR